jgi:hypothetical protein
VENWFRTSVAAVGKAGVQTQLGNGLDARRHALSPLAGQPGSSLTTGRIVADGVSMREELEKYSVVGAGFGLLGITVASAVERHVLGSELITDAAFNR